MTSPVESVTPNHTSDSETLPASGRLTPATVLTVIGGCCVVLGGLVAAVTGPLGIARGSWLAAYLVLVAGVAQYAMGRAHGWHPNVPRCWGWGQLGTWNLGNGMVIGGTLSGQLLAVDCGSVLLIVALAIALYRARRAAAPPRAARPWVLIHWGYRAALFVLAVSIPVGIMLSHLRHP